MTQLSLSTQPNSLSNGHIATRGLQIRSKSMTKSCRNSPTLADFRLRNLSLALDLSAEGLRSLHSILSEPTRLVKKQHLYRQADAFKSLYFVSSGFAKSYVNNADGDELAVSFFMPGEIIGLDGLFSKHHTSSIVALEDTFICEIPYLALEKLCAKLPTLQRNFNVLQSGQIVQELDMTILRGHKTAAGRLAAFLTNLSQRYENLKLSPSSFRLPMTRKDIGACLGLTLETVSRLFTTFQDQGLIEVDGKEVKLTNLERKDYLYH